MTKQRYHREYYHRNKVKWQKYREVFSQNNYQKRKEIAARAKTKPCMDCGIQYNPWVMQFDHRPNEEKIANIAYLVCGKYSIDLLEKEIAKCDVVCANCHAERTHQRKQEN